MIIIIKYNQYFKSLNINFNYHIISDLRLYRIIQITIQTQNQQINQNGILNQRIILSCFLTSLKYYRQSDSQIYFIIKQKQQIQMNQYTEQISPWKQNQQNIINKQHKPTNPSSKSPKLRKSLPGTHYHLQSPRFQNKAKLSTYEPYIVTPQLFKNISIKQSNFKSLPKFKNKKTLEKSKQKQSLQKISQLLSLGKSYTKLSQHKKQKKQNILRNTLHLKDRLQNIINKNEVNTIEYKIIRNKSQIIKNRYERIIGKQKNIIFLYQSYSLNKNNEGSPKKKIQNHILDKLLQDWK